LRSVAGCPDPDQSIGGSPRGTFGGRVATFPHPAEDGRLLACGELPVGRCAPAFGCVVAMCLGFFIPLMISVANDLRPRKSCARYQ